MESVLFYIREIQLGKPTEEREIHTPSPFFLQNIITLPFYGDTMSFNRTLLRNANREDALLGRYPVGGAPLPLTSKLFLHDSLNTPQELTLHPTGLAQTGSQIRFSFAIPFPKDALSDINSLVITDDQDNELTTHVENLVPWRDLSDNSTGSVRAARVWMNYTFNDATPIPLRFKIGTRSLELGAQTNYKDDWVQIANQPAGEYDYNDEYTTETILEPLVYATQSSTYLCSCNLRPRCTPINTTYSAGGSGYDESAMQIGRAWEDMVLGFANSSTNRVGAHVTTVDSNERALVPYETTAYSAWLYDRAQFLYVCYIRSGELKWLRSAVRASQFYGNHISPTGYFDLRSDKLMYSYGLSPLFCIMTTGDTDQSSTLDKIVLPGRNGAFNPVYTVGVGWTERLFGYLIEQELANWEYTGDTTAYNNVKSYLSSGITQVANPVAGRTPNGTIQHTILDHEGGSGGGTGNEMIFSPWMCTIMFNSYFRAWMLSGDSDYLRFIAGYHDEYVGIYYTQAFDSVDTRTAYYLAGEMLFTDGGIFADIEHNLDVSAAIELILFSKKELLEPVSSTLEDELTALKSSFNHNQSYWYRPTQATIDAGFTIWRGTPYRRPTWQHLHSANLTWLESARGD